MEVKEISVETLQEWRNVGKEHQLIDVRESYEIISEIQVTIFLAELPANLDGIRDDVAVIVDQVLEVPAPYVLSSSNRPEQTSITSQEAFLLGLIKLTLA